MHPITAALTALDAAPVAVYATDTHKTLVFAPTDAVYRIHELIWTTVPHSLYAVDYSITFAIADTDRLLAALAI